MASSLTVSVVVPLRDDADSLRRLLGSLQAQTRRPDQLVVADNGSSDDGPAVARAAGAAVVTEESPGIAAAASHGYDEAACDLILRLDADSVPPADWIERMVAAFAADDDLGALTGPGRFLGLPGPLTGPATAAYMGIYFTLIGALLRRPPLFGSNLAMRRTAWRAVRDEVHRRDPGVHDDLDLTMHLAPRTVLRLDRGLVVGMSSRPLFSAFGMFGRLQKAAHTLWMHRADVVALRRPDRGGAPRPAD